MLLLTTLLLLMVALLLGSYWGVMRVTIRLAEVRHNELRAYYAARGGLSDAMYEVRQGHTWSTSGGLSPQWVYVSGNKFYKSTVAPTPLAAYDYPVTISVTMSGNPDVEKTQLVSVGQIKGTDNKSYSRTLTVSIIRTLSGEVSQVSSLE